MTLSELRSEIRQLTLAERILLVEEIWDGIAEEQGNVPLPEWQRQEIDRRLASYRASPDAGSTWEEVKSRIKSGR